MKHTPTPWKVAGECYDSVIIETVADMPKAGHAYGDNTVIGSSEWTFCKEEDAEHIVKCVNAHDGLVESLREIVEHLESIADAEGFKISDHAVYQRAKEALKAAGEKV